MQNLIQKIKNLAQILKPALFGTRQRTIVTLIIGFMILTILILFFVEGTTPSTNLSSGLLESTQEAAVPSATEEEYLKDIFASWEFDQASGQTIASQIGSCGNACQGTLKNFANTSDQDVSTDSGWTSKTRFLGSGALLFNGQNNYVEIPDNPALSIETPLTLEIWIKANPDQVNAWSRIFVWKHDSTSLQLGFNDQRQLTVQFSNQNTTIAKSLSSENPSVDWDRWIQIALTANPDNQNTPLAIYVNGSLQQELIDSEKFKPLATPGIYLGAQPVKTQAQPETNNYFSGTLDSLTIYNTLFSSEKTANTYSEKTTQHVDQQGQEIAKANTGEAMPDGQIWLGSSDNSSALAPPKPLKLLSSKISVLKKMFSQFFSSLIPKATAVIGFPEGPVCPGGKCNQPTPTPKPKPSPSPVNPTPTCTNCSKEVADDNGVSSPGAFGIQPLYKGGRNLEITDEVTEENRFIVAYTASDGAKEEIRTVISDGRTSYKIDNSLHEPSDECSENGVLPIGTEGQLDDNSVTDPSIIWDDERQEYLMAYTMHDGATERIGLATSSDGYKWCKKGLILDIGADGEDDDTSIGSPALLKERKVICTGEVDDKPYYLWYSGNDGAHTRIFYATNSGDPESKEDWTKQGLAMDLLNTIGSQRNEHVADPTVVLDIIKICPQEEKKCCCREAVRTYHMWYSGNDGNVWRIFYAQSQDAHSWESYDMVLDLGKEDTGDDNSAYKPSVVLEKFYKKTCCGNRCEQQMDPPQIFHMWYTGGNGAFETIFKAESENGEFWNKINNEVPTR